MVFKSHMKSSEKTKLLAKTSGFFINLQRIVKRVFESNSKFLKSKLEYYLQNQNCEHQINNGK